MASRFVTVSKDEILGANESAAPTNTRKEAKFGFTATIMDKSVGTVIQFERFLIHAKL